MKRDRLRWLTARPIAHRGFHDLARGRPENTLAAFDAAVNSHYAIECDLHLSADGVPMVFHDADLLRLTGIQGCVRDLTAAELGDLRVLGTGEWIPTLDEVLALVAGRVPLVLELKSLRGRDAGLALETVERLKSYAGPAAVMSFAPPLLMDAQGRRPESPARTDGARELAHRPKTFPHRLESRRRLHLLRDRRPADAHADPRAAAHAHPAHLLDRPHQGAAQEGQAVDRPDHV